MANLCKITSVETYIIAIIKVRPIVHDETFRTDVLVFTCNIIRYLTSHWPMTLSINVSSLTLKIFFITITGNINKLPIKDIKLSISARGGFNLFQLLLQYIWLLSWFIFNRLSVIMSDLKMSYLSSVKN